METPSTTEDPRIAELRQLRLKQANAIGDQWTQEDAQTLVRLQTELEPSPNRTPAHLAALHRQSTAGIGGEPELTPDERKLIQEVNGLR